MTGATAKRPTFLIIRSADAPNTTPEFAERLQYLARVRTLAWTTGRLTGDAISRVVAEHMADSPVVLLAEGDMAGAALAADAPQIRGVVVIDPPEVAEIPARPVEVIRRKRDATAPAFAAAPGVRLHRVAADATSYDAEFSRLVHEVSREACRRAGASAEGTVLDTPLLDFTPLVSGEVGYVGPEGEAFVEAYMARHPEARAQLLEVDDRMALDVLVLGAPLPLDQLRQAVANLKPDGWLVARWSAPDAVPNDVREVLAEQGLQVAGPADFGGTFVFRAQRAPCAEEERMLVAFSTHMPWMMDIRTRLPFQQMTADPGLFVRYLTPLINIPQAPLTQPKIAIFQRPANAEQATWLQIMSRFIAKGWVCVIEYDDHPFLVADLTGLERSEHLLKFFGYVHAVQTSVGPLAQLFGAYNPEVAVFANTAFDLKPFPPSPRPRRVFYGATPRGAFPADVARSLAPVIEQFPDTEFVSIGGAMFIDALPTTRKTLYDYTSYEAYLELMASCSVSLTPIEAAPLNETKSDAKFLDASRAGVLTIASPTIYERTIRHGENGLIAREIGDWPRLLLEAFSDPACAERIARTAWEEVRYGRMFVHQLPDRKAWYRSLWERRDELTETAMERLPGLREEVARLRQ